MEHLVKQQISPVLTLQVDRVGQITRKIMDASKEAQLTNTLLRSLYSGIRVATVEVPTEPLDPCEQAMVEQALTRLEVDGTRYSLVGASGSAKEGRFYAVESMFERRLAERFKCSPQAAMTYLGILVSSCKVLIEEADCRLLVVEDHELGTNDCRGWISQAIFRKLQQQHKEQLIEVETNKIIARMNAERADDKEFSLTKEEMEAAVARAEKKAETKMLRSRRLYQFRLAFEKTQAKGSFKLMADEVAQKLEADIILPKSSVKPRYAGGVVRTLKSILGDRTANSFRGPVTIGIRDVSRDLTFQSSYTLVEHAPSQSIELEIKPVALEQIQKVRQAYEEGNFTELFNLLGTSETQEVIGGEVETDPEYTSSEYTVADAALLADGTGYMLKHPFVNGHLQKVLARWAYRLFTSGGFVLPGYALADDGYIVIHEGQVFSGSDWMPKDSAFAPRPCKRGLVVRYPIRMKEDLLPVENITTSQLTDLLYEQLLKRGCRASRQLAGGLAEDQLQLAGTLTLHSETAARNGGDFDFDMVCIVEGDRFPLFVADRFSYQEQHIKQKNKTPKPPSPWWNLPQVAMQARGNQIGSITDLKTSCLAKGRADLGKLLVDELQNALDQLKFGTQPNQDVIKSIRSEVTKAPWLGYKQKRRIDEMPEHLNIEATDNVGQLYNFLRKELGRFLGEASVAPLSDFRGIIGGESFTQEIYQECYRVNRWYASQVQQSLSRRQQLSKELDAAQAAVEAVKNDSEARKKALFRRNQASGAYFEYEKRSADELKALIRQVRLWGQSKNGTRLSYLSALHSIVCRDKRPNQEQNNPNRHWIDRVLRLSPRSSQSHRGANRRTSNQR